MKRILVITPYFYPHIGGSEKYMEELYSYLKSRNKDIDVDVLSYSTGKFKKREEYRGLNVYRIKGYEILKDQFILPDPVSLFGFLVKHKDYDLVHTSTRFFDSSWWGPLYAKLIGSKVVLTDHCAYHPVNSSELVNLAVRLAEATIVRFALHFYDGIFAENKKTKDFLRKNFKVGSKIAYPGLFEETKIIKKENKRLKVVYVGRMLKSKGVGELLDAAKEIEEADFIFAGEGSYLSELKKEAKKIKNVRFLGKVPQKEVMRLLKTCDIFAYPSRHSEGLPLALIQAGQNGLAVVASKSGAISEIINDRETGLLVKKGNSKAFREALGELVKNSRLRNRLGNNLKNFTLKTFSWQKTSDLVLQNL